MLLLLSGCGGNNTPTRHNDITPLTSIEIVADSSTIAVNTSTRLRVTGNFSGLFSRDITDQAVWQSDTPGVAAFVTATDPIRVTGTGTGSAGLTATVGNVSATFRLTVSPATVTNLTISPPAPTIAKGLTTQFRVTGIFSDSTTQDITFDAGWSSSDTAVATVSDTADSKGFARALAAGTTTISAGFGGVTGTTLLTVTEPLLQSITVSPANASVLSLSKANFTATGTFSDGTASDITSQVSWTSSNTIVAPNPTAGATTTSTQGTTTIGATLSGVSGTSTLKVTGGNLVSMSLPPSMTLVRDTVGPITVNGLFSNNITRDITGLVSWTVTNTSLATVSAPTGNRVLFNALATGTTTITATAGTRSATTSLTVSAPVLVSLAISPASLDLTSGTSDRLTATASFSDNTTQDVTANTAWSSNSTAVASVGTVAATGERISGVATGTATISAVFGNQTKTVPVTVRTRNLTGIAITPAGPINLAVGNSVSFTVTASYGDGTTRTVTEDTAWTIDNPNVAIQVDSQNQPGQIIAVDNGSATLNAAFGGKTLPLPVTVRVP